MAADLSYSVEGAFLRQLIFEGANKLWNAVIKKRSNIS